MSGTADTPQTGKGTGKPFVVDRQPMPVGPSADTPKNTHARYRLNHADTIPHIAPGEPEAQRKASNRAWLCLMLATTPEGWTALINGETLPVDQLAQARLQRARRRHEGA